MVQPYSFERLSDNTLVVAGTMTLTDHSIKHVSKEDFNMAMT